MSLNLAVDWFSASIFKYVLVRSWADRHQVSSADLHQSRIWPVFIFMSTLQCYISAVKLNPGKCVPFWVCSSSENFCMDFSFLNVRQAFWGKHISLPPPPLLCIPVEASLHILLSIFWIFSWVGWDWSQVYHTQFLDWLSSLPKVKAARRQWFLRERL